MQVITKNPIIVNGIYEDYLSLDGTSSKEEILAAQKIINQLIILENTAKPATKWLKTIKEDGIWGSETETAYSNRKTKVDAELDKVKQLLGAFVKGGASGGFITAANEISKTQTEQQSWWKKRTKNQKVGIVATSVLLIGVIGYFTLKASKKG